ncbi:MAG: type II secretion system protein [Phycisphaerales bacterium]|nr:type II secretion system protein [Phycisphaerales bacterium]
MKSLPRRAFTLVEILVVVGIISLLVGLLITAIGMARKASNATGSQANLKQWGAATINYTSTHKERLPWEGLAAVADMPVNLAEKTYWANAVAELAGEKPYSEIVSMAASGQDEIPIPPTRSLFIDPGASANAEAPWDFGSGAFCFSYVPNMRLNDALAAEAIPEPKKVITMAMIADSSATVLMFELRSRADELSASDPYFGQDLSVNQSDWRGFANRHFDGGHIVFADGHVSHVLTDIATRSMQGSRDPAQPLGDWNKPKLIWNPKGQATY